MAMRVNVNNLDSAQNVHFARQLEAIEQTVYMTQYPQILSRQLIPVKTDVDAGATSYTYRLYDMVGAAKLLANYGDDLPRVDLFGVETNSPIRALGDAFGYSFNDVRVSAKTGFPLESEKAMVAREAMMRKEDDLCAAGDSASGLGGFLSNASVTKISAATISASTLWVNKTADQIIADMNAAVQKVRDVTNGIEAPQTMLLPEAQYALIASTPRSTVSDTTILKFFLANNPWIKSVVPWWKMKGAGDTATDRLMIYDRNPIKVQMILPLDFTMHSPQEKGLEIVVPCEQKTGGVVFRYPLSALYMDGI